MAKPAMMQGCGGCVAMLAIGIAIETAIAAICINVFGLGEGSTFCFVLAVLCIVLAFAAYHDDKPAPNVKSQEPQEDSRDTQNCPYCFSIKTTVDENGIGFCYDCESYWGVEDAP